MEPPEDEQSTPEIDPDAGAGPPQGDSGEDEPLGERPRSVRILALLLAAMLFLAAVFSYRFLFGDRDADVRSPWRWTAMSFPPIDPRYGHASVWSGSKMIVWGGFSGVAAQSGLPGPGIRADGAEWTADSGVWEVVPPAPSLHRPDIPAIWNGKEMVAWGGDPTSPASAVAYSPDTKTWRQMPPSLLPARGGQTAIWTGTEVIIWGGRVASPGRPPEQPDLTAEGAALNPEPGTWRPLPPAPVSGRDGHLAVWTGREMIIWGGAGQSGATASELSDGAAFLPAANTWRTIRSAPASIQGGTAVWTGKEVIVWGHRLRPGSEHSDQRAGGSPSPSSTYSVHGLAYDPIADNWRRLPPWPLQPRANAAAAWNGRSLIVWGGYSRPPAGSAGAGPARDGAAYDPRTNRWSAVPPAPIRGRDTGFSMIRAGDDLVVWGGKASETKGPGISLADGARLRPRSN